VDTFYTIEKLGNKQRLTPEGFLLCEDVPIARTGTQLYSAREVPELEAGNDGTIVMERHEEDVFRPETIASVNGKTITVDHPNDLVRPHSFRDLVVGVALNARRGIGIENDLLLADLLIADHDAIEQVRNTRGQEVSAGYNYNGVQIAKGRGKQTDIWINHIALVDSARCGSRCSIGDEETKEEKPKMTIKEIAKKLKDAWASKDCAAFDGAVASLKDEAGTEVHLHTGEGGRSAYDDDTLKGLFEENEKKHAAMDERMTACEGAMKAGDAKMKDAEEKEKKEKEEQAAKDAEKEKEENAIKDALADEAPAGEEEKAKTATDSSYLVESFQTTKSKAEIIAPGIHLPAFDKKAAAKDSYVAICGLRRKAIQMAARDAEMLTMIFSLTGKKAFDANGVNDWHCSRVKTLFDSLSEMKRLANNAKANENKSDTAALLQTDGEPMSAEVFKNKREKARKDRGQNIN
jgi:hypothetical protein